jgi:hypothetical protein
MRVRPESYCPIARLHGDWYISARDQYLLRKPGYEEWLASQGHAADGAAARDLAGPPLGKAGIGIVEEAAG